MRQIILAAFAAAGVFLGVAGPAGAQTINKIAANQFFVGAVNGTSQDAVIGVVCPGPEGRLGHPLPDQSTEVRLVLPPALSTLGFTGSADSIQANLIYSIGTISVVTPLATFEYYSAPAAISTNLEVPCSGVGTVAFDPITGGPKARASTVLVTFENIAVTP